MSFRSLLGHLGGSSEVVNPDSEATLCFVDANLVPELGRLLDLGADAFGQVGYLLGDGVEIFPRLLSTATKPLIWCACRGEKLSIDWATAAK